MQATSRSGVRSRQSSTWAHWRYSDEDRRLMAGAALEPTDDAVGTSPLLTVLLILIGIPLVFLVCARDTTMALVMGGVLSPLLVMVLPAILSERLRLRRLRRTLAAGIQEATIKPRGLYVGKVYLPLFEAGLVLTRVDFRPGSPAILTFTSGRYRPSSLGDVRTGDRVYHIPVPRGKEEEAAALVHRFRDVIVSP